MSNNFFKENEQLKIIASNILLFVHQREQGYNLRKISGELPITNESANNLLAIIELLGIENDMFSAKLEEQIKEVAAICKRERELKGNDSKTYFKRLSVTDVTLHSVLCNNCGNSYKTTTTKSRYCSTACRVSMHRKRNVTSVTGE